MNASYYESSARARIANVLDAGSFIEYLPPRERWTSPHLAQLDTPSSFDDGIIIGCGLLGGRRVLIAAQEGAFMGGAVGEVHGAKLTGLLLSAATSGVDGVLLLLDSGGVRLHEANAGLIAVSEVMRAVFSARRAGIPVLTLIGSTNGCFGGMGIVSRCTDAIIMSEEARLAMSGPEVIETANGVDEYDSRDRALVWRTCGGKHRYLTGDCDVIVPDSAEEFRAAALRLLDTKPDMTRNSVEAEYALLADRLHRFGKMHDATEIWKSLGIGNASQIPVLDTAEFLQIANRFRVDRSQFMQGAAPYPDRRNMLPEVLPAVLQQIANALFPHGHQIQVSGDFLSGTAMVNHQPVSIVGTTNHAQIGVELALAQAGAILQTINTFPRRPIIILVDTQGQRLRQRDELLGINSYMAHLASVIELARGLGHAVLALVYDQALSGGFITSGLMADLCYALDTATIRVMSLPAMARITKVPETRLAELAQANPVFAPGAENYRRMGGVEEVWPHEHPQNWAEYLAKALATLGDNERMTDHRAALGQSRSGRLLASKVIARVRNAVEHEAA